jgi:hypothetical protein
LIAPLAETNALFGARLLCYTFSSIVERQEIVTSSAAEFLSQQPSTLLQTPIEEVWMKHYEAVVTMRPKTSVAQDLEVKLKERKRERRKVNEKLLF